MCQLILLHSCGYLNKILVKNNVATDEGNGRNDIYIYIYVCCIYASAQISQNQDEHNIYVIMQ